jgi:hypothetical protein
MKKNGSYRVRIKVGDAQVDVEGAKDGVVKIVEALTDVLRGSRKATSASVPIPPLSGTPAPRGAPIDIRSFFVEKRPSSDVEAAAASAYYYQYLAPENERRETIDPEGLQKAFRLARRPLPKRTIYTLTNARNAGYLDSGGGPGQFRLNPVGYNLVEHTLGSSGQGEKPKGKSAKARKKKP